MIKKEKSDTMKKYDIAVIGGGFAGVAAALAAAREGARVIIIEKSNCLGGAAVNCLVNPFMPYSTRINNNTVALSAGIFKAINERLKERHALCGDSFLEEELKYILNEMVAEANIDLLFHAYLCRAQKDDLRVQSVTVATRSGEMTVNADYFIDATGDAQLAYLADCPTVLGREQDHLCQPMTLCFRLGNVDVEKFLASFDKLKLEYEKARVAGEFINPRENILVFKTLVPNVLHFNTTRVVKKNPTVPEEVTEAEVIARRQVYEVYDFMKKHADGLENSFLMMTAAEIGVRESRMIVGDYVLTEKDCKGCTKFEDAIAACNYDIDIHNPEGSGTSHYFFAQGEYYTIPYRSLIPKNADNILVAGRCISSDHGAQASYRIMPTVCCIGEAAGTAVGLASKEGKSVREVDIQKLQQSLKKNQEFWRCSSYKDGRGTCTIHFIRDVVLETIVKEAISELADFVRCYNSAFLYLISEKKGAESVCREKSLRVKTESAKQRISDLDKLFSRIYEDNILGKLSDERYSRMANEYEAEQKRLISEVEENEKSLIELQKQTVDMKMLYQGLMEFTEMKQLTPTVVNKLIERIEIHNNEKKHSHNNVKVDIYFTAVGLFDIPTEQQLIDTMERVKQKNAEKSA